MLNNLKRHLIGIGVGGLSRSVCSSVIGFVFDIDEG
jgi:hypothetical protein